MAIDFEYGTSGDAIYHGCEFGGARMNYLIGGAGAQPQQGELSF